MSDFTIEEFRSVMTDYIALKKDNPYDYKKWKTSLCDDNQFKDGHGLKLKGKARKGELKVNKAYRFAIHRIKWQEAGDRDKVIEDIKVAVDELYRKYDAYLNYVEGYYAGKGSVDGCISYDEFMRKITA